MQLLQIQVEGCHATVNAIRRERFRQIREAGPVQHAVEPETEIIDDIEVRVVTKLMLLHEVATEHGARIGDVRGAGYETRLDVRVIEREFARHVFFAEVPDLRAHDRDIRIGVEKRRLLAQPLRFRDVVMIDARDIFATTQVERPICIRWPSHVVFEREKANARIIQTAHEIERGIGAGVIVNQNLEVRVLSQQRMQCFDDVLLRIISWDDYGDIRHGSMNRPSLALKASIRTSPRIIRAALTITVK
ncbi:hypothetical protein NK8_41810 [Caballeronia sp. NK8]|nr:hypothetical protein [Caballeronia sp. NK8]BCQ25997.1 hypothetical protein NK8_41810 [Caballeronia sp. NK8]